jgi:Fe-S cluster biogenesis protein NfuA
VARKERRIVYDKVLEALEVVRPTLVADGGDVELVEVTEQGVVRVRLQGTCHGCPMSMMTLKNGIERIVKEHVPGVVSVEAI